MKRLTESDDLGNWAVKGLPWKNLHEGQVITRETREKLYGCLCKLKDYEEGNICDLCEYQNENINIDENNSWAPFKLRDTENEECVCIGNVVDAIENGNRRDYRGRT